MELGVATDVWKKSITDYQNSASALLASMLKNGFDPMFPIDIDPARELLNGSHRLACALALGIEEVPVCHQPIMAWAPEWGYKWFAYAGLGEKELESLKSTMEQLKHGN